MNSLMRPVLVAGFAVVLTVCVFGLRLTCSPVGISALVSNLQRDEELEQKRRATYRRMEARRQLAREWIDGRLTLAEVLEQFQELDVELPDFIVAGPKVPWGGSNQERRYHLLRKLVEWILRDRPAELSEVLRRLEKDYQQLQASRPTPSTTATEQTERSR